MAGLSKARQIREKMRRGETVIGAHTFYLDPSITEALGLHGFEFVWIDGEHSAFDKAGTNLHIMAAAAADTASIVRVPWNDPILVKPILEMGPDGIIFPMIRTAEEAKKAGVRLAFENVGYHGSSIYTQEEYIHALDGVDPIVGYLIDVGHAHVNAWDIPGTIDAVSHRLYGLHLHDNRGNCDAHLPMGEGTIPWDQVLAAIGRIQTPECEFVLEYAPMQPLERLRSGEEMLGSIVNKQGT